MAASEFEQLSWPVALPLIEGVNPQLARALRPLADELERRKEAYVYRRSYRYGTLIVDHGDFVISRSTPQELQGYRGTIPLCLTLKNRFEAFISVDAAGSRMTRPLRLFSPGDLFGVFESCNERLGIPREPGELWLVSAGAISARIEYPMGNRDLKDSLAVAIEEADPRSANEVRAGSWNPETDQARVIMSLARRTKPAWYAEAIIFPEQWKPADDKQSSALKQLISDVAWKQSKLQRTAATRPDAIINWLRRRSPKWAASIGEAAVISFLGHLQAVASGEAPAHRPHGWNHEEGDPPPTSGPFGGVLEEFEKFLQRPRHMPVLLEPYHLKRPGEWGWCSVSRPLRPDMFGETTRGNPAILGPFAELLGFPTERKALQEILPDLNLTEMKMFFQAASEKMMKRIKAGLMRSPMDIPKECLEFADWKGTGKNLHTKLGFFPGSLRLVRAQR